MKTCPESAITRHRDQSTGSPPTVPLGNSAPSAPLGRRGTSWIERDRVGDTTHRGSISTGHSWETWFPQRTLVQTRQSVREHPCCLFPFLGCLILYRPQSKGSDIVAQDACCGPCYRHPVLPAPTQGLPHQNLQSCYGSSSTPHLLSPFHPLRCCCPRSLLRLLLAQYLPQILPPAPMESLPWQGRAATGPPGHHPVTFLTRSRSTTA